MNQQSLRSVALPAVRAVEGSDQFSGRELIQPRNGSQLRSFGINAIDVPAVVPGAEIEAPLNLWRYPFGMLDHKAVHVGNVERAVRTGFQHGRSKPVVAGREEFGFGFFLCAMAREGNAVPLQHFAMDEIVHGLTNENAIGKFGAE